MDLALDEGQRMLQQTARNFMEREAPKAVILNLQHTDTGCLPEMWSTAAELGWLGMLIPQQYGGGVAGRPR